MRRASEFRQIAWDNLRGRYWWAVLITLVACVLGGYAMQSPITFRINGEDVFHWGEWTQTFTNLPEWFQYARYQIASTGLFRALLSLAWSFAAGLFTFSIALFIIGGAVELGFNLFNIALYQAPGQPKFEILFSRFHLFGRALFLRFLMFLKILAWSLLFIVPGIVAAYRYALAPYLLAENPELTAEEAIEKSKALMLGYKGRLFCLQFSFIGWYLLSALTGGVGWFFLAPYTKAADTAFYLERTGRLAPDNSYVSPASSNSAPTDTIVPVTPPKDDSNDHPEWV
jgi:uncharacterized membrane protein